MTKILLSPCERSLYICVHFFRTVFHVSCVTWFFCLVLIFHNGFQMFLHLCVTILCRNCVSTVHLLSCLLVYIQMCFPYFVIGNQKSVQTSFRKLTAGKIITNSIINLINLITLLLQIFKECWAVTLLRPLAARVLLQCRWYLWWTKWH